MQTKPIDPAHFVELHKLIGLALWHGQAFEDTLARFITLILKLPPSKAEAEVLEVLEKLQSKTLGSLITELKRANSTNSVAEFEQRVNGFLQERNWLVHASWREHHMDLFSPERLPALFSRLDAMAREALALQRYFGELTNAWTRQQPEYSEGKFDEEFKKILRQRGVIE